MIQNKLKVWRRKLGFTQQELTQVAGVSIATIVLIERYNHLPGDDVRVRLSKALNIPESVIFPNLEGEDSDGD